MGDIVKPNQVSLRHDKLNPRHHQTVGRLLTTPIIVFKIGNGYVIPRESSRLDSKAAKKVYDRIRSLFSINGISRNVGSLHLSCNFPEILTIWCIKDYLYNTVLEAWDE